MQKNKNMEKLFDLDYETRSFRPTVEWMAKRYDEANKKLFGGVLGKCDFGVFTTGRGSRGGINGWFKLTGEGVWRSPINYTSLFVKNTKLNSDNFVELGKPRIELNGNKRGSEWAFMVTLVHEMCHYYTYRNGFRPARPHGKEFKKIASEIARITDNQIIVTTHTSPERSEHFTYEKAK